MLNSVVFITTGQPSTNPRLVKEVNTLIASGFRVKVIYCFYQQWASAFDEAIFAKYPGVFINRGGHPANSKGRFFWTRLRQKVAQILFNLTHNSVFAPNAINRTHSEALSEAKNIPASIFIAHNLGALPAAVQAARYHKVKAGYDAEDMHSGQYIHKSGPMYLINKLVEERYFPQVSYFTAASPLIALNYKLAYPFLEPVVIDNVFPKTEFDEEMLHRVSEKLKLFWFSQTVGAERGLEEVIIAMGLIPHATELHLLGQCSADYKHELEQLASKNGLSPQAIVIHTPIPPDDIFAFAAQFDIGLAAETGVPFNRDICLTNKLFTYIQSGLAVLASDTLAQTDFLNQHPQCGKLYQRSNPQSLADCLTAYARNRSLLVQTRLYNYQLGQDNLNWETESRKFLQVIKQTLQL